MATLNYWTYQAQTDAEGIGWNDVLSVYEDVRAEQNQWIAEVRYVRKRAKELGYAKSQFNPESDLAAVPNFDVLVSAIQADVSWLARADDADRQVWDMLLLKNRDWHLSEDGCFEAAIARLMELKRQGGYVLTEATEEISFDPEWF
jgi:hypothetical protein